MLLDKVETEYKEKNDSTLLKGYNLRNLIPKIKEEKPKKEGFFKKDDRSSSAQYPFERRIAGRLLF